MQREEDKTSRTRRGRKVEARGFFAEGHPQKDTHKLRKRTTWVIPVLLGDRIPRADRSEEEREDWARSVMILFVPWRHPGDLKNRSETWFEAFQRRRRSIHPTYESILKNINVLAECRDARSEAR
ncbi:hypothetical protein FKP32DRAFT_1562280, partial [Trametes sanguinea]